MVDLQPFWEADLAVQIHVVSALAALVSGTYLFARRKGTRLHRKMGKFWVAMMAVVALSSFFIHQLRTWGVFSPIHLLSIFTLLSLVHAIWMVRTGNIRAHQFTMIGLYSGGLILAGLLTFSRDLLMHRIFFGRSAAGFIPAPQDWPGGPSIFAIGSAATVFLIVLLWNLWSVRSAGRAQ